jgi:hypothetical protein
MARPREYGNLDIQIPVFDINILYIAYQIIVPPSSRHASASYAKLRIDVFSLFVHLAAPPVHVLDKGHHSFLSDICLPPPPSFEDAVRRPRAGRFLSEA